MCRWTMTILLCLTLAGPAMAASPAQDVRDAAADAEALGASGPQARYLTLPSNPGNIWTKQPTDLIRAVNFGINSLSCVREMRRVTQVSPSLLRVDVAAYTRTPEQYQAWLNQWNAIAATENYYSIPTEIAASDGKPLAVTVAGGWTDLEANARLRTATNSTGYSPIMRADFFLDAALSGNNYYGFTCIPSDLKDFQKQLGLHQDEIDLLEANLAANLMVSNFTLKPRRVGEARSPLGGYHATLDAVRADAFRDPFRRPISSKGSNLKFDASEIFATAPNGLFRVAIFDANGKRLEAVDPKIATDTLAKDDGIPDGSVIVGSSCFRCHNPNRGLQPFSDDQFAIHHTKRGTASIHALDPNDARLQDEAYNEPRMQRDLEFDRGTYDQACQAAAGGTAEECGESLRAVLKYFNRPVGPETVSIETGVPVSALQNVIDGTRRSDFNLDCRGPRHNARCVPNFVQQRIGLEGQGVSPKPRTEKLKCDGLHCVVISLVLAVRCRRALRRGLQSFYIRSIWR